MLRIGICFFSIVSTLVGFEKVVIWGHKLHTHTHSYIHYGFFRAFQAIGFPVLWLSNEDDLKNIDFSHALFITEGQVDQNIPLREDCLYILHNCNQEKYSQAIDSSRFIFLQVYRDDYVLNRPELERVAPCIYFDVDRKIIYMPWATDLLPKEIDQKKEEIKGVYQKKQVCYLGTMGPEGIGANTSSIEPFLKEAERHGFAIIKNDPWGNPLIPSLYQKITQESLLAPALQGEAQVCTGYIPCRIFKNISYGCLGITNSYRVYELFEKKIVYDSDPVRLFYKSLDAVKLHNLDLQYELMDFVRDNHTYVNRIEVILEFIKRIAEKGGVVSERKKSKKE